MARRRGPILTFFTGSTLAWPASQSDGRAERRSLITENKTFFFWTSSREEFRSGDVMTGGDEKRCTPSQTRPTKFPLQTIIKARTMPTRQSTSTEQLVPALTHFSINKRGEKKKMPSKLLKSKFPVIKRLLFLFFFFFHGLMKTYLPHILRFCSKVFF